MTTNDGKLTDRMRGYERRSEELLLNDAWRRGKVLDEGEVFYASFKIVKEGRGKKRGVCVET